MNAVTAVGVLMSAAVGSCAMDTTGVRAGQVVEGVLLSAAVGGCAMDTHAVRAGK